MASIEKRLRRLEDSNGGLCPECGLSDDSPTLYEVQWLTYGEEEEEPPKPPCPVCGRGGLVIEWDDGRPEVPRGEGGEPY